MSLHSMRACCGPLLCLILVACTTPAAEAPLNPPVPSPFVGGQGLVLWEGLPHPMFEKDLLRQERASKRVLTFHGEPFYDESLTLKADDEIALAQILGGTTTFSRFWGPYACGGFHPDYAIDWSVGDDKWQAQLCFTCREVRIYSASGNSTYELTDEGKTRLLAVLQPRYQKYRPINSREGVAQ